jgi:hypothetical protein
MSTAARLPANVGETLPRKVARFDVERIRADFPILQEEVRGRQLLAMTRRNKKSLPWRCADVAPASRREAVDGIWGTERSR